MNKKLSIVAIILVIIGGIGTVSSAIASIPYVTNRIYKIDREINKEQTIYKEQIDINKLNIETLNTDILVKKHAENSVKIVKKDIYNESEYTIENKGKELVLREEESKIYSNREIKNLDDVMKILISNFYEYKKSITIYIPSNVDLNVSTQFASIEIEDNILLSNVSFKTLNGNISLPKNVKNLNLLDIVSKNYIRLSMTEILGIKNININSNSINIYSDNNDIFIEDIEKYIPDNININTNSNSNSNEDAYSSVDIRTDIPIAKNLSVNAYDSEVNLDIPIDKYKFKFDMKALKNINLEELISIYNIEFDYPTDDKIRREIKGYLNKNLQSLEKEYYINIEAQNINTI